MAASVPYLKLEWTVKRSALTAMSMDRKAAHALNYLARESLGYFGRTDGPALADFLQDYFCGDDPAYEPPGKYLHTCSCCVLYLIAIIDETEDDLSMNCDGTVNLLL